MDITNLTDLLYSRICTCAMVAAALSFCTVEASEWYTFSPKNDNTTASLMGMNDWSPEPAGKRGRIERKVDKYFYAGKEIKLWGLNDCYSSCAPEKELSDKRAALYSKYGINTVRLHKYADGPGWAGIQSEKSFVKFDKQMHDRMDYFVSKLKDAGIFVKLSPTFGIKFGEEDLPRIPFHEEIGSMRDGRIGAGHGWVWLSTELQDLQIEQTVNILNHVNPYTRIKYADDPAIFCVEMFNEDCIFFFATIGVLQKSPTLRARIAKGFAAWLKNKYKTEEAWKEAWGENAVISDPGSIADGNLNYIIRVNNALVGDLDPESFDTGVVPWGNPWYYDASLEAGNHVASLKARFLDTMHFLGSVQDDFYSRFEAAVRKTGFKGEMIGSNWHAGSGVAHFLNLQSDARLGLVDRHNYCGGGDKNNINVTSSLSTPGMGVLSSGLQQVANLPFMFSEWIHCFPSEWVGEGPAIIGAYAMGLQGWDISYIFQNRDSGGFTDKIGRDIWDVTNPALFGTFPTISRMVRRFDVSESEKTLTLNVSATTLETGEFDFKNTSKQDGDEKSFTTDKIPTEALAAVRVGVNLDKTSGETPTFDVAPYLAENGKTIISSTKQLSWTPGEEGNKRSGHFIINTAGTKGFVGFASGEETLDLGHGYSIAPAKGFSVILLSAKGEKETLDTAKQIVLTATARARNTGMEFNEEETAITSDGAPPVVLEAVAAKITLPFSGTLEALDHDGIKATGSTRFSKTLDLDTAKTKTPFYLIRK